MIDYDPVIMSSDITSAQMSLEGVITQTPLLPTPLSARGDSQVPPHYVKAECLQAAGSHTVRGAFLALDELDPPDLRRGVVVSSTGPYALALMYAWRYWPTLRHITVVLPAGKPTLAKLLSDLGAQVHLHEGTSRSRARAAERIAQESGQTLLLTTGRAAVCGAATVAREMLCEQPTLAAILAPVGSGALLAGIVSAAAAHPTPVRVIGAEPLGAGTCYSSHQTGTRVLVRTSSPTGLAADLDHGAPARYPWHIWRDRVDMVQVTDAAISAAMDYLLCHHHLGASAAGATAMAAALAFPGRLPDGPVGVLCSGGPLASASHLSAPSSRACAWADLPLAA
ncbi:pyridoxal-phosphate dependent enzyme [Streptomyces buecherae]|uniref:pyridoxal-phosphate dependent enzyme n=1 Tax=Streptomyces buecherae TaxID=2763006 RepID=UPI0033D734E6